MHRLELWLRKGARFSSFLKWLPLIVLLLLAVQSLDFLLMSAVYGKENLSSGTVNPSEAVAQEGVGSFLLLGSVAAPLIEELIFRVFPFSLLFVILVCTRAKGGKAELPCVLLTTLLNSFCFGYIHGGMGNVLIQGISGLAFSVAFLKVSSLGSSIRNIVKGSWAGVVFHSAFNTVLTLVVAFCLYLQHRL